MAELSPGRMPRHVAIIMDGNGRWAAARGLTRTAGHAAGEHSLFDAVEGAVDLGIEWMTVFAFSTENWTRGDQEVAFLMEFAQGLLTRRLPDVQRLGIRVRFIGDLEDERIPCRLKDQFAETAEVTKTNTGLNFVFAFNYGSRAEIARSARRIAAAVAENREALDTIDEEALSAHLDLPAMPDPDLIIRTSGEVRISNFLLWQAAYSELVFIPVLWPDFNREVLADCIAEYQARERRFGKADDRHA